MEQIPSKNQHSLRMTTQTHSCTKTKWIFTVSETMENHSFSSQLTTEENVVVL